MTDEEQLRRPSLKDDMVIEKQEVDFDRTVLSVVGEIDICTAPKLREQLLGVTTRVVVVDLAQVSFLDVKALEVLVAHRRRCHRQGREMLLVFNNHLVHKLFRILDLYQIFRIYTDQAAALAAA